MILREPLVRKFVYLEGLCLATAVDDRAPLATRVVSQYLGPALRARRGRITVRSSPT